MSQTALPPFQSLLKSRDVEDPINLYFNRPLAYLFAAATHSTSITPNQITLLSLLVGLFAAACWMQGSPPWMIVGGVLLWTSAILDGADGIVARAKNMQSQLGRAFDGTADMLVTLATIVAGMWHLWVSHYDAVEITVSFFAIATSVLHVRFYDFYKELYLTMTRPEKGGESETVEEVEKRFEAMKAENAPKLAQAVMRWVYVPYLKSQRVWIARTNPLALRNPKTFVITEESAAIFKMQQRGPMRIWAWVSLAPHMYLFAIFGMFDRIDAYLWLRLLGMNALFLIGLVWQRQATQQTLREFQERGWVRAE